jgi:protein-S-isoprenylcysteine O-methyltransferase Ste14
MKQINSIWGVGPKFLLVAGLFYAAALAADRLAGLPPVAANPCWLNTLGAALLLAGGVIWDIVARTIFMMYNLGRLYRQGLYARCRHPLYADIILLVAPGVSLLLNSWPALAVPFLMYLAFRRLIVEEERGLIAAFGDEYLQYKNEVNAVFPRLGR